MNTDFGPQHYVPVLKVKRGEKQALASISPGLQQYVVPLLEIVKRTDKTLPDHLTNGFSRLAQCLSGYSRCLLDVQELEPDGQAGAAESFNRASAEGITFTPVTGISRSADVYPAVALADTNGIALRLTDSDFQTGQLATDLNYFLSTNSILPSSVDLIVDLGDVGDLIPPGIIQKTMDFLTNVPSKNQWRTLTVAGSAFPLSMAVVDRNSSKLVPRADWVAWRDGLYSRRAALERLPTYSDCAIQHPIGVEGFDPRFMRASPTMRYTLDNDWLLVKGESARVTPASNQFPTLATQLVYGSLQNFYRGAQHCAGCRMIQDSANGVPRLGSPEIWRRIGTIHHITTVVHDGLGSLLWP